MPSRLDQEFLGHLHRNLGWIGLIMLLVGVKLLLSFFFPSLRSRGELMLSSGLLLVYTFRTFRLRSQLQEKTQDRISIQH